MLASILPMTSLHRKILLICALILGGFILYMGSDTSLALEPSKFGISTVVFWLVASLLITFPFWLPAILPSKYKRTNRLCRWVCAICTLVPGYFSSTIVMHNLGKPLSSLLNEPGPLILGMILTTACVVGVAILIRSSIKET